eukprot:TRINITY_DN2394_c0_g1_i1.p1 TRINITY_DN2394_c0_g1~~TRINITY_DN2394_c0_g1_i1.p1  ORF type:complete len:199 (+),score=55.56 TRINITY_DN2394_c0_g1_i1:50-646(+)
MSKVDYKVGSLVSKATGITAAEEIDAFKASHGEAIKAFKATIKEGQKIYLLIHKIEGKDLSSKDTNGKSDPFIKVKGVVANQGKKNWDIEHDTVWKSKHIDNTLNPQWTFVDSALRIGVPPLDHLISFEVYDHDTMSKDEFMGRADLSPALLATLAGSVGNQVTIVTPLLNKVVGEDHEYKNIKGELHITFSYKLSKE